MSVLQRISINIGSLMVGALLTLGFFYTFYDADSLTADVLQQQLEQDSTADILVSYKYASFDSVFDQMHIILQKELISNRPVVAELLMSYDDTLVDIDSISFVSSYPLSHEIQGNNILVSLHLPEKTPIDTELFTVHLTDISDDARGLEDKILLTHAKFLIDEEFENLAIGTNDKDNLKKEDNDGLH